MVWTNPDWRQDGLAHTGKCRRDNYVYLTESGLKKNHQIRQKKDK